MSKKINTVQKNPKGFFSKRLDNLMKRIRTEAPFVLRFISKAVFVPVAVVWFFFFEHGNYPIAIWAPIVFMVGNLVLETVLYRFFKLKESNFQDNSLLKGIFFISPEQLDQAALKTNAVKWMSFGVFTIIGLLCFGISHFAPEALLFSFVGYGICGISFLRIHIYEKITHMPKFIYQATGGHRQPVPASSTDDYVPDNRIIGIDSIQSANVANGHGPIPGALMPRKDLF